MIQINEKKECCGCYACYNICPKNAITMNEDDKGFKYPIIDKQRCINCDLCKNVCPIINKKQIKNTPEAYSCVNKDETIRKQSSSGGMFTLIAEEILNLGGVVFGARFNENFDVVPSMPPEFQPVFQLLYIPSLSSPHLPTQAPILYVNLWQLSDNTQPLVYPVVCYLYV